MKYSEAGDKIEALDERLNVKTGNFGDLYVAYNGKVVAGVSNAIQFGVNTDFTGFAETPNRNDVYKILVELAATPVDERKDEERHYIRVFNGTSGLLMVNLINGQATTGPAKESNVFKTKFTDSEIRELKDNQTIAIDWSKVRYWPAG